MEFLTHVKNWYQMLTHVKNWYQIITYVKNLYLIFTYVNDRIKLYLNPCEIFYSLHDFGWTHRVFFSTLASSPAKLPQFWVFAG